MSILQFFRILWARRLLIIAATVVSTLSAFVIVQVVPPRYVATSRVMLDVIKPDPVTGEVMATSFLRAYTKTQIQLLRDYSVAGAVVDALKWSTNPRLIKEYAARKAGDDRDFKRWAAQIIIDGTDAKVIEGSNILEINYTSEMPERAKLVADGLTKAYADTTLQARRSDARRNADWYEVQAVKAKDALFQAEAKKSAFERQSGIMLQDNKVDIDSARLAALAAQGSAPIAAANEGAGSSSLSLQVAQLEAEIAQSSKTLGPNHPQLLEMKRRRDILARQAVEERSATGAAATATLNAARATAGLLDAQKNKVLAQREKVEQLRLLQDDVDLRRDQYNKAVARAAQLRQEAEVATTAVTLLGAAVTPQSPVFPNKPLILGGGFIAGLGASLVAALLLELFGRRIRSAEDLRTAVDVPVLAIVSNPNTSTGLHLRERLKRILSRSRGPRLRNARA
ncbi:MAG: hypothetical protein JWQ29_1969 [Phenylobacterium sp.]|nr:hypothetical protein [Phenylobacterium sp.]